MNPVRQFLFNAEGQPRLLVWCAVFVLVLVPRISVKHTKQEEGRRLQDLAARHDAGMKELQEAKRLFAESQFLEATLRARSSMDKLRGSTEYNDAERVQNDTKNKLLEWRKKQASNLLREAEHASQRPGFSGGGLVYLRRVYTSACQIPPDSSLYQQSRQLLNKATRRAMKGALISDLPQKCEAVREGTLDPSKM